MVSTVTILSFAILYTCLTNSGVNSMWVEGNLDDVVNHAHKEGDDWLFLTRFCFLSQQSSNGEGIMYYELRYLYDYGVQNLLFYYDTPGQWESVYRRGKTCQQKVDVLNDKNSFPLERGFCSIEEVDSQKYYYCKGTMDFTSSRERWWYVVISRCQTPHHPQYNGTLNLEYKLHMTNGDDFLYREYSADQFYIVIVDIVFFILYIKMMILSTICAVVLMKRQLLHTTYRMYMAALILWTLHLLCMVIAWVSYGRTGWEISPLEVTGRILQAASNIIFILMLILIAKGYTIVRGQISVRSAVLITIFIVTYIVAMIVLFIWEAVFFDPAIVLYYYESPPGYGMIIVILIGWLWFTVETVFTMKKFKTRNQFYILFYILYTIWFWAGPIVILLAMFSMAKWTREKTVNGVQLFVTYVGHIIFYILTLPHKVNSNFPFHIKTTQISTMVDDGEDVGQYSVTSANWPSTGPNLEFFVTSKGDNIDQVEGRRYSILDRNSFPFTTVPPSDRTPLRYPQAMSNNALPPIGTRFDDVNAVYENLPMPPNSHLLPPYKASELDAMAEESRVLPPLHGTGLAPIVPSELDNVAKQSRVLPPLHGTGLASIVPSELDNMAKQSRVLPPLHGTGLAPIVPSELDNVAKQSRVLPPLHGTGLAPIVPSDQMPEANRNKDYSKMFQESQ